MNLIAVFYFDTAEVARVDAGIQLPELVELLLAGKALKLLPMGKPIRADLVNIETQSGEIVMSTAFDPPEETPVTIRLGKN